MRGHRATQQERVKEISDFLGVPYYDANVRLSQGFGFNHNMVAADFRAANPKTDDELLRWYKHTDSYIWELTAYHLDPGFNYTGQIEGIATHLKSLPPDRPYSSGVLCLGDGIGDLTFALLDAGLLPIYHDLLNSMTARFAVRRFANAALTVRLALSHSWMPPEITGNKVDAIVALDFFEHMPNVEEWVMWCADALVPGGQFLAVNAFAMGDEEHGGSIPMHLSRNNKYADPDESGRAGWDSLLMRANMERAGGWWRKPL